MGKKSEGTEKPKKTGPKTLRNKQSYGQTPLDRTRTLAKRAGAGVTFSPATSDRPSLHSQFPKGIRSEEDENKVQELLFDQNPGIDPKGTMMQNSLFGMVIRAIRLEMEMSYAAFAEYFATSRHHIMRWETGGAGMTPPVKFLLFDTLHNFLAQKDRQWDSIPEIWLDYIPEKFKAIRGWAWKGGGLLTDEVLQYVPPHIANQPYVVRGTTEIHGEVTVTPDGKLTPAKNFREIPPAPETTPPPPAMSAPDAGSQFPVKDDGGQITLRDLKKRSVELQNPGAPPMDTDLQAYADEARKLAALAIERNQVDMEKITTAQAELSVKDAETRAKLESYELRLVEKDHTIAAKDELIASLRERIDELKSQAKRDSTMSMILDGVHPSTIRDKPIVTPDEDLLDSSGDDDFDELADKTILKPKKEEG